MRSLPNSAVLAAMPPEAVRMSPGATNPPARRAPHLVVSAHFVFAGRVGGAEHMLYNLLHGLAPLCTELLVLCASERNLDHGALLALRREPGIRILECGGPGRRFVSEQRACFHPGLSGELTLFPNYFVPPIIPRRLGRVATVLHDLQYLHYPQHFSARKRLWLHVAQHHSLARADRVVVISEFVADDVLRHFGRKVARKLVVIPNPVDWDRFGTPEKDVRPLRQPYVLAVSAQYPHKNLATLVRAFAEVARRDREVRLVLCGQKAGSLIGVTGRGDDLEALIAALGIRDRVHLTGYVEDQALGRWYRHAALFAFPSIFEGFGMPAVEALGLGVPTITTRCASLPETTLGMAEYVEDPFSVAEWASHIGEVLRDPARRRPAAADIARLRARYGKDRVARQYADL